MSTCPPHQSPLFQIYALLYIRHTPPSEQPKNLVSEFSTSSTAHPRLSVRLSRPLSEGYRKLHHQICQKVILGCSIYRR